MKLRHALAMTLALSGGALLFFEACLPSARFPSCKTDEDCKDNTKAKQCFDTRCVECKTDDECGDGRYCETRSRECHSIGDVGAAAMSDATASAAPSASAAPAP